MRKSPFIEVSRMGTRSIATQALQLGTPERWSSRASFAVIIALAVTMWAGVIALAIWLF